MNNTALRAAIVTAVLALPVAAFAQSTQQGSTDQKSSTSASGSQQYGQGGSSRCDSMSGSEKDQCLKDEGAKTDSKSAPGSASDSSASGGTSASGGSDRVTESSAPTPEEKTSK